MAAAPACCGLLRIVSVAKTPPFSAERWLCVAGVPRQQETFAQRRRRRRRRRRCAWEVSAAALAARGRAGDRQAGHSLSVLASTARERGLVAASEAWYIGRASPSPRRCIVQRGALARQVEIALTVGGCPRRPHHSPALL